ncbi:MAG: nicotinate dehydrogenase large molybdopterin subunit, partial [Bacillota bacterium]|nr:nicotinate dehydrogenase large molybdopterin subunit [Bacillota bacterium]
MPEFSVIGKSVQRIDGQEKVTGATQFAADLDLSGALCLKVLRSNVAHAHVKSINVDEAMKVPGVVGIFTHKDIGGINGYGIIVKDQPALTNKVRFKGDALALVAAESETSAKEALGLIKVDLEE